MELSPPFPEVVDGGVIVRDSGGYPTGKSSKRTGPILATYDKITKVHFWITPKD